MDLLFKQKFCLYTWSLSSIQRNQTFRNIYWAFFFLGQVTESSSGFFLEKRFPIGLGLNLYKNLIVIIICEIFLSWIIWNRMTFFKRFFAEFFSFFSLFQLFVYLYTQYTQFSCFWMCTMNNAIICHCFFLSHEN